MHILSPPWGIHSIPHPQSILHPLFPHSVPGTLTFMDCINRFPCPLASKWIQPVGCTGGDQRVKGLFSLAHSLLGSCRLTTLLRHSFWWWGRGGSQFLPQFYFWAQGRALSFCPFNFLLVHLLVYCFTPCCFA